MGPYDSVDPTFPSQSSPLHVTLLTLNHQLLATVGFFIIIMFFGAALITYNTTQCRVFIIS